MRLLFLIMCLLLPGLAFSATPVIYTCGGNQPDSVVNIQFDASSPSENYVTFTTSHNYRAVQYLYSTPVRFSMKSLTDSSGNAKLQVVGFWRPVSITNIQCSPDDTNLRLMLALAGIVSAGLIFFGILDAM